VAELVDASVSKTDEVTLVPVRFRPRVRLMLKKPRFTGLFLLGVLTFLTEIFQVETNNLSTNAGTPVPAFSAIIIRFLVLKSPFALGSIKYFTVRAGA
jgi:hypothetical protein